MLAQSIDLPSSQVNCIAVSSIDAATDVSKMIAQRFQRLRRELIGMFLGKLEHEEVSANDLELVLENVDDIANGEILWTIELRSFRCAAFILRRTF